VDTRRAESFSDGVFAVAITVLVFNLLAIDADGTPLSYHLLLHDSWPKYAAYAVGFLTIGIMWLNHHTMMAHVAKIDRTALVLNIFLLMAVVAMPFPTALVAENLTKPDPAGRVAAVSYGVVSILISVGFALMWTYVSARQESLAVRPIRSARSTLRFTAGLAGYVVGTLVAALFSAYAALAIYALIAVYYLFEHLPSPSQSQSPSPEDLGDIQDAPSEP
jgi:uncharacterized membrane protein